MSGTIDGELRITQTPTPEQVERRAMWIRSGQLTELLAFATRWLCTKEISMAKKQSSRGRKQDRARVAGGQDYETRYEARKTGRSKSAVKKAVKKVGNSRKRVERSLSR
jgi:hypothetical protein